MGYLTKLVNTFSIVPNVVDTRKYTIIKIDHDKSSVLLFGMMQVFGPQVSKFPCCGQFCLV